MDNGERALRLEKQLDAAQRITHVGSWEWDAATNGVVWSDELYRIVGLPVGSPVDAGSHEAHVHPDDRVRLHAVVDAALAIRGQFSLHLRMVRPDGSLREVDMLGEPVFGPDGKLAGLLGTSRDVTDELRREQTIRLFTDIVEGLQIGLSVWRVDSRGGVHLVGSNSANERLTGITVDHAGQPLDQCFPAAIGTGLPGLLRSVDHTHPQRELAACRMAALPGSPVFSVKAFSLPDRCIGVALEDVTQRVQDQRLAVAERRVLQMLAASEPLEDVLGTIALAMEELVPEALASVLLVDATGTRLMRGAAPSLPEAFRHAVNDVAIGPAAGACGTAAHRREPVFISNIDLDPLWTGCRHLVEPHGLRACWSLPILNEGRVLGTFALYFRTPRPQPGADLQLMARAVHIAAIAIERRKLDERLAQLTAPPQPVSSARAKRS